MSIVDSGVRVRPSASPATVKNEMPSVPRRARGARDHDDQVGDVTVDHEHLLARQRVAVAAPLVASIVMPAASHLPDGSVNASVGDRVARRDAGQQRLLLRVGAGREDRVGREHDRREVRRAQQHAAHLLEHDAELDEREALAAVLLGDREALQHELLAHLLPHRGVVALGRLHQTAYFRLGRLGLEELPHRAPQLFLFLGEGEVHVVVSCSAGLAWKAQHALTDDVVLDLARTGVDGLRPARHEDLVQVVELVRTGARLVDE